MISATKPENYELYQKIQNDSAFYGQRFDFGCTDRVRFLNKDLRDRKRGVDMHRARCYTKIYKENPTMDKYMLRALSVREVMSTLPLTYTDGELIVGLATEKPLCHPFQPEVDTTWVMDEGGLEALRAREADSFYATDEECKEFREEIYPFWKDKCVWALWQGQLDPEIYNKIVGTGFSAPGFPATCFGSHMTFNYHEILTKGTNYYKEIIEQKIAEEDLSEQKDLEKRMFYRAAKVSIEAIEIFSHRWAEHLRKLAEEKPERKEELLNLAEICDHVPMNPARTFHEALQAYWFLFNVAQNDGTGILLGFGRLDQELFRYYDSEIKAGTMTRDQALELVECFYIKTENTQFFADEATCSFFRGYGGQQQLVTGGVDRFGNDAANDLSFLFIDALIDVHTLQPSISTRLSKVSSEAWRDKILELIHAGMGYPSIFNDDTSIPVMRSYGWGEEDANDWIATGCEEIGKTGNYTWGPGQFINFGIAVDMAFTNGKKRLGVQQGRCGDQLSVQTGDVTEFKTYEEFEAAVMRHIKEQIDLVYVADQHLMSVYQNYPLMIISLLANAGLDRGLPYFSGGCYTSSYPGYAGVGTPDLINSLAAVKKLVYDDKMITMAELRDALEANFEGYDDIYQMCLNAPKYGNDDLYVDMIGQHIMNMIADEVKTRPGIMAKYDPEQDTAAIRHQRGLGLVPQSGCVPNGGVVGALPSGRKATEALGDSTSPSAGTDISGPTASLKSVSRIPISKFHGSITNMYLTRDVLETPEGRKRTNDMIRTAFANGVGQLQFNVMDKEVLEDAQKSPEDYPTLIVRVTGYSAYFTELDNQLQNEIIKRTVFEV